MIQSKIILEKGTKSPVIHINPGIQNVKQEQGLLFLFCSH
jgi:hypothetical protein